MNNNWSQPKPDDRSDNAAKIQEIITNTKENMKEAEAGMRFGSEEDIRNTVAKNQRREASIAGLQEELKDEQTFNNIKE